MLTSTCALITLQGNLRDVVPLHDLVLILIVVVLQDSRDLCCQSAHAGSNALSVQLKKDDTDQRT